MHDEAQHCPPGVPGASSCPHGSPHTPVSMSVSDGICPLLRDLLITTRRCLPTRRHASVRLPRYEPCRIAAGCQAARSNFIAIEAIAGVLRASGAEVVGLATVKYRLELAFLSTESPRANSKTHSPRRRLLATFTPQPPGATDTTRTHLHNVNGARHLPR